jgi:hypothetical protein
VLTTSDLARYESPRRRANVARAVLLAILVVDLVAVWSSQVEHSLLERIDAGEFVSDDELTWSDNRQVLLGYTQFGLLLLCAIKFLAWFVQAYRDAEALGANGLRFSPRWAIGAWFVPFLNLVRPKQIANDIWRASSPQVSLTRQRQWEFLNPPAFLTAWWLAFLASGWTGNATRVYADGETLEELQKLDRAWMVADGIDALAALLAIVVVTVITRRLEARYELARASAEQSEPS